MVSFCSMFRCARESVQRLQEFLEEIEAKKHGNQYHPDEEDGAGGIVSEQLGWES